MQAPTLSIAKLCSSFYGKASKATGLVSEDGFSLSYIFLFALLFSSLILLVNPRSSQGDRRVMFSDLRAWGQRKGIRRALVDWCGGGGVGGEGCHGERHGGVALKED
eukprot:1391693-Amorphochlora_amoeboformis.AAC.1